MAVTTRAHAGGYVVEVAGARSRAGNHRAQLHSCSCGSMSPVRLIWGASAVVTGTVFSREPVVWWIAGYPFPAGPMVVCICAVIITRVVIGLQAKGKAQWALDIAITALCLLVTVLWVQAHQLDMLAAGITGIGIAAVGAGIIGMSKGLIVGRIKAAGRAFAETLFGPSGPSQS